MRSAERLVTQLLDAFDYCYDLSPVDWLRSVSVNQAAAKLARHIFK